MEFINGNDDEFTVGIGGTGTFGIYNGATFGEQFSIDTSGNVGIGVTDAGYKLHVVGTDTVANASYTTMLIDHNCSGSDTCTGDRLHTGLLIDMDSSASGGDTNHEHRVYGIRIDARHSGDSDLCYGIYSYTRSDHTSGQCTNLRAGEYVAVASGTGVNYNIFGLNGYALKDSGSTSLTTNMFGVRGEVEVDAGTCTNAYAIQSHIDRDGGTITNGYLYYGSYSGSVSTKWGIYLTGETKNYFSGNVGIGTTSPSANFHIHGPKSESSLKMIFTDGTSNLTFRLGMKAGTSGYQNGWCTIDPNGGSTTGVAIYDALWVQGTLGVSSSKNFIIDHPIHPTTKKLIHSAVESPRVDLIYRGSIQLENGKAIVNIDRDCTGEKTCAMEDGTFESLCRDPVYYLQNTTDFSRVIGTINNNLLTIISEDTNSTSVINWMVVAERKDKDILESDQTDDNGRLVTEILDDTERINKDGSNRY